MKVVELIEALDKAADYKVVENSPWYFQAEFVSNGREIMFDADLLFDAFEETREAAIENSVWEIAFVERDKRGISSWDITSGGKEFEVFATIKKIIEQFFHDYKPKIVKFTSDKAEGNRGSLYQKLFTKFIPDGYKLERDDESSKKWSKFKITRK